MPSRPQRITNGQRAAVAGLVIAGLTMEEACKVAGSPIRLMQAHLPPNWHRHRARARKWKGDRLTALKRAYCDRSFTVAAIARLRLLRQSNRRFYSSKPPTTRPVRPPGPQRPKATKIPVLAL